MTQKVKIHLQPINVNQIMTNNTLELSKLDTKCQKLIVYIRKKMGKTINEDTPIFLYYNRFALYPDTTIQEIVDHSPGITEFDINFSFEVQYG